MGTYDALAELPLTIDEYALEERSRAIGEFQRVTVTIALRGGGETGLGEDVNYDPDDQRAALAAGPVLPLAGTWTVEEFSRHLEALDLSGGRGMAYESAAVDLALRQAGRSFADAVGRSPRPLKFVVSLRLGEPPSSEGVDRRVE